MQQFQSGFYNVFFSFFRNLELNFFLIHILSDVNGGARVGFSSERSEEKKKLK
jgi:hypothetical protein